MLIKREKTDGGLPLISFIQRAPYLGYGNLLIGHETPDSLETEPDKPGVLFIKQPVWLSVQQDEAGRPLLTRRYSQREQEDQDLPVEGQAWLLEWINGFTLDVEQIDCNGHAVTVCLVRVALQMKQRIIIACHTGEDPQGVAQLVHELDTSILPLCPNRVASPAPVPELPPESHAAGTTERMEPFADAQFPMPVAAVGSGRRLPILPILAGIVALGVVIALAIGIQRSREEAALMQRQEELRAPGIHVSQVWTTIGSAIDDALRPYCPDSSCIRAEVREGAFNSWEIVATPAGLRLLLYAYLEPETRAPMARLRIDLATQREDGDLTKVFPPMVEIINRVMTKLNFPATFRDGKCAAAVTVGTSRYSCEAAAYDLTYGAFDVINKPAARLFRSNSTFTMLSRGPFRYDRSGDRVLRSGP